VGYVRLHDLERDRVFFEARDELYRLEALAGFQLEVKVSMAIKTPGSFIHDQDDQDAPSNVEVFKIDDTNYDGDIEMDEGWYWWYCFPGCLPDSEPMGPFGTYQEAVASAKEDQ
jgi:hypothetical protein